MKVAGGCHCGAVRFSAEIDTQREVLDCNCSICRMTGYLHVFVPHGDFSLERSEGALTSYRFGSGEAEHLFCSQCGVKSFYQPRSHPDCWSVNFHCLDHVGDWVPDIVKFDGANWEKAAENLP